MSQRPPQTVPAGPTVVSDRGRLHTVLSAGQEQKKVQEENKLLSPVPSVGGAPSFYDRGDEGNCKRGVYCKNGKASYGGGEEKKEEKEAEDKESPKEVLRDVDPSDNVREYIRQVMLTPDRWEANGLLMLKPKNFDYPQGELFDLAYRRYDVEQGAAVSRGNAHSTVLRARDGSAVGTLKNVEGNTENVHGIVVQAAFVDGDGPRVGTGYTMRIYLQNAGGARLGTLFALSKRNIEANSPSDDDLEYYLFVDLSETWSVRGSQTAPVTDAVNKGPVLWDEPLQFAMEFAAYRSIALLYNQFSN